jgi:hypothetical protein
MICKIIKLVTGETVAGNVVEETAQYIDVMRPVRIVVTPKSNDSVSVLFARWDHTSDFDLPIRIFKSGLVSVGEPMEDFKQSYKEMYDGVDEKKSSLSFDDEDEDEEDNLSNELEEIVNNLQKMASNTNNKTYH